MPKDMSSSAISEAYVIHCASIAESPEGWPTASGKSVWSTGLTRVFPGRNSEATKTRQYHASHLTQYQSAC